jgi:hypothetical protein
MLAGNVYLPTVTLIFQETEIEFRETCLECFSMTIFRRTFYKIIFKQLVVLTDCLVVILIPINVTSINVSLAVWLFSTLSHLIRFVSLMQDVSPPRWPSSDNLML